MVRLDIPEKIISERLIIQRLRYEDASEIFYTYASKPKATRYVSWPTHLTMEDTRTFLDFAVGAWEAGLDYSFSVRLQGSNKLIGTFGVINDEGKLQFGYVYSPTYWGHGYATEVCTTMMALLRQQPYVCRIHTFVDVDNIASCKVLIKSGLVEEARLSKWFRFINQGNEPKDCFIFYLPM